MIFAGEDRWLCTLLLQQGYRVDYAAGADAFTNAFEGFNEFFQQRKRWGPSTLANIMALLQNWQKVVKENPNISWLYIVYLGRHGIKDRYCITSICHIFVM